MDFFTLFSPDGVMLETNVVCIVYRVNVSLYLCGDMRGIWRWFNHYAAPSR